MFLIKLTKAGAGVGPLCGVQTLPEPSSSTAPPPTSPSQSLLGIVLCCSGSSGYFWFRWAMIMSHQKMIHVMAWKRPGKSFLNLSGGKGPCSLPRAKVPWPGNTWPVQKKKFSFTWKPPGQSPVPLWVPRPSLWGPKKSIGRGWRKSSLGWDNKGTVSLNLIL